MKQFSYIFIAAIFVATCATAEKSLVTLVEEKMLESSFLSGKQQILMADISPNCKELALTNLADAQTNRMTCHNSLEVAEDVGLVLGSVIDSVSDLVTDLNTVINDVPSCFSGHYFWNLVGFMPCFIGELKPLWNACANFIHYSNYYKTTINDVKELMLCLNLSKTEANQSVRKIVSMAKLCKMH